MNIRVLHLCLADDRGGAAIGARRLHQAMLDMGVESKLAVIHKFSSDENVLRIPRYMFWRNFVHYTSRMICTQVKSKNPVYRSINVIPTGTGRFINQQCADIIQMHWVGADTISIGEIANLKKPIVWKLPDMWAFSGLEHYKLPEDPNRFQEGYLSTNRPTHEYGLDFDKWIWRYKCYRWKKMNFHIVGPSKWITECSINSKIFRRNIARHILNPLNIELYKPVSKKAVRKEFKLPSDKQIVMFGSLNATQDRRKGYHLLKLALKHFAKYSNTQKVVFVVLGSTGPTNHKVEGFDIYYLGLIHEEEKLVRAYNTADAFVLPAEIDNLPNVIKEATCCGIPCVGFNVGGMPDLIHHLETGFLAKPYDTEDLSAGIKWVLDNANRELSELVRQKAVRKHDPSRIVRQYLDFYNEILSSVN